jgi:hypothetical protein
VKCLRPRAANLPGKSRFEETLRQRKAVRASPAFPRTLNVSLSRQAQKVLNTPNLPCAKRRLRCPLTDRSAARADLDKGATIKGVTIKAAAAVAAVGARGDGAAVIAIRAAICLLQSTRHRVPIHRRADSKADSRVRNCLPITSRSFFRENL